MPNTLVPDAATEQQNELFDLTADVQMVDVDDIYNDAFQRPLDERWLKARDGKLDRRKLQVVILSDRPRAGKRYSNVDGQHRTELVRRNEVDPERRKIRALIFRGLSIEEEAQLFADFQQERRNVSPYQRFNAQLVAGSERAKAIERIVREEGFALGDFDESGRIIKAIRVLEKIYDEDSALLRQILRLVRETWGDLPGSSNQTMLRAMWYFLRETDDLNEERFIERLSGSTPLALVGRAHHLREFHTTTGGIPKYLAEAIQDAYRTKRRTRAA